MPFTSSNTYPQHTHTHARIHHSHLRTYKFPQLTQVVVRLLEDSSVVPHSRNLAGKRALDLWTSMWTPTSNHGGGASGKRGAARTRQETRVVSEGSAVTELEALNTLTQQTELAELMERELSLIHI